MRIKLATRRLTARNCDVGIDKYVGDDVSTALTPPADIGFPFLVSDTKDDLIASRYGFNRACNVILLRESARKTSRHERLFRSLTLRSLNAAAR